MKLWIKIMSREKIIKDTVAEGRADTAQQLHFLLTNVCDKLNCPTPLVTRTDADNLQKFNHIKYRPQDFVEKVDFDYLEAVHLTEKKKQQKNPE